ncbi:ABC transporter substrate-binding protein [Robertmurraya korlensis]|uniref:ABC transporter substrate-binding protein n=1 Tax=Robertmurraya korlensis TaxID=519977 RepID=UPI0008260114|nr:ABC transporter substrate-binding protein [Robertmurraya korlensis]
MRKGILSLLTLILFFSLVACSSTTGQNQSNSDEKDDKDKKVTLRVAWWGNQPRHDYTLKIIELYEKENPNVKIEPEYASWDDYWKKMAPQAAANRLPDVIQMDLSYITEYSTNNQLADLTPFYGKEIDTSDHSENFLNGGKIDGKYYGLTASMVALSYQYDPEVLKKIGMDKIPSDWTWDDYKAMGENASAAGVYIDNGPGSAPDVLFNYYLRTKGQRLYSEDGTALGYKEDKYFVEYFTVYSDMVKNKSILSPDAIAQVKGLEDNPVVKQESIGIVQWASQLLGLQQVANRPLEISGLPGPDTDKGLFIKPGMFWSMANSSENKSEAAKFIDFMTNNIEANKLMLGDRGIPGSPKVQEALVPLLTPVQKQIFDYVAWAENNSSAFHGPDPAGAGEVINLLKNFADQTAFGVVTPEEAAKQFRQQAEAVLGQN